MKNKRIMNLQLFADEPEENQEEEQENKESNGGEPEWAKMLREQIESLPNRVVESVGSAQKSLLDSLKELLPTSNPEQKPAEVPAPPDPEEAEEQMEETENQQEPEEKEPDSLMNRFLKWFL